MSIPQLPVPPRIAANLDKMSGTIQQVHYEEVAAEAEAWAQQHSLAPASQDRTKIALLIVDNQITFCLPPGPGIDPSNTTGHGELSVAGAVQSSVRIAEFIYRNLGLITSIYPTLDTHTAMQIFMSFWVVDENGAHPPVGLPLQLADIESGKWKVNPQVAYSVGGPLGPGETLGARYNALQAHFVHYARELAKSGKFDLMIWPYHSMLGGVGHALVPSTEEACFFHTIARASQTSYQIKGGNPLTENFSIFAPEVLTNASQQAIAQKNARFMKILLDNDIVIIVGQAKSHCMAWTIKDLLTEIQARDPSGSLVKKVYLPEDCTDPVVIPGVIDFTEPANEAYKEFADAGMHVVKSTDPIDTWPEVTINQSKAA